MTFDPNRADKIAVIGDLVYEYANLMAAAHFGLKGDPPWRTNCADAFLLGCRKLGDFLMKDKRFDDDVLAMDYLPLGATRTWNLPIWIGVWQTDMNKYLAHITYRRTEDRDALGLPHWNHTDDNIGVRPLRNEFNKAWWDFRESVTDSDFCAKFDEELRECETKEGFEVVNLRRL